MNGEDIKVNDLLMHKNGNTYSVTSISKTQVDGIWFDSVTYVNQDGQSYNRLVSDFNNFEKVGEVSESITLAKLFEMQTFLNNSVFSKKEILDQDGFILTVDKLISAGRRSEIGPNTITNEWLKKYSWALGDELRELNEELLQKWWSKDHLNMQNIRVEIIDILHFWICLCQASGMTAEDVARIYFQKNQVNLDRQKNDYSKLTKNESDNKSIL